MNNLHTIIRTFFKNKKPDLDSVALTLRGTLTPLDQLDMKALSTQAFFSLRDKSNTLFEVKRVLTSPSEKYRKDEA